MAFIDLGATVEVVRIPELPAEPNLANDDAIPIWHASNNVTSKVSLTTLRSFIETGSGGTVDHILSGGSLLYIVPSGDVGLTSKSFPEIAGFSFVMERDGYPLKVGLEYNILVSGGFTLIDGSSLIEGQRYRLDVFELYNGMIQPSSGVSSAGGGFIVGTETVNTNVNISEANMNKLHQVRGVATALTITLPDVDLCPANSFVPIEALINNTKQHRITTTSGQSIYINNEAVTSLYLAKGEYLWFFRTTDGWYVINDKGNFSPSCIPQAAYKVGFNQVECIGQTLLRADYPRLWAAIQALGGSLVANDATWSTVSAVNGAGQTVPYPYRGCFSPGDGSTTFRLPDLRGSSLRGLLNIGGSDSERVFNTPGGFQKNLYESHFHSLPDNIVINVADFGGESGSDNIAVINPATATGLSGGSESRMDNIGVIWVINY